jgi:hypothetical protein
VEFKNAPLEVLEAIILEAYSEVAPIKLAEQVKIAILKNC